MEGSRVQGLGPLSLSLSLSLSQHNSIVYNSSCSITTNKSV